MKTIRNISLNKNILTSSKNTLEYKIIGDIGSVFSLQVKDSSSPNKFYNFKTNTFVNTFSSENTLSKKTLTSSFYDGLISIPAASSGAEYTFLVFVDPTFNTKTTGNNSFFIRKSIKQNPSTTVRFSTASDQAATNYVGLGTNVGSTVGSTIQASNAVISITDYEIKDNAGVAHGYKFEFNANTRTQKVADSLQPIDNDFFTKQTKETVGSGSSATAMVLNNVNNLVVGMSLADIESSSVDSTGTLGVLTFPTITAINKNTKTITLSSAHSWSNAKDVEFRAYGSNLITQSTGGAFKFNNFIVEPADNLGNKKESFGTVIVNSTMGSASTTIPITTPKGISSGARIFGPRVDTSGNNNLISSVNALGTSMVVNGNQQLSDNTVLRVLGAAPVAFISGILVINKFPNIDTDVFYDIDRAIVLSTLS